MKNYRLERAAYLLKTAPSMKVADIAAAVGYESAGKFSAAFRKKKQEVPRLITESIPSITRPRQTDNSGEVILKIRRMAD